MLNLNLKYSLFLYNKTRKNKKIFCKAPYSSLFFDYKGNVFACFANKHLCLGKYNTQSINVIWNGHPLQHLRKSIENRTFNQGCHLCKHKLLQHHYSQVYARRYDYLIISEHLFPTSIEVQLSNRCNLNCIMCVVTKDQASDINIAAFKNYIREIIPFLKNASFSGGEPFLINEYFEIWEEFYKLNKECIISVNTNATILNEKVINILEKLKFNICVSIDGFRKETFENIRKNADRDLVYKNLLYYKNYALKNNTSFNVKVCALKQNIYEFPEIFNYFNKQEIPITINEVVYPLNTALWNTNSQELKKIINFLNAKKPIFNLGVNNYHNNIVWNDLIKMITIYYRDALKFEKFILKNKKLTNNIKTKVIKRIKPVFANNDELDAFFSIIENYTKQKNINELKTLYFFFLIAPFDRMIGEIEIRNEWELKNIFNNIIKYFYWK